MCKVEFKGEKYLLERIFTHVLRVRRTDPKPEPHRAPSPQLGSAQLYPMAGAVLGSCIGAPVGFLAGIKIGGLASLSGIIAGMIVTLVILL